MNNQPAAHALGWGLAGCHTDSVAKQYLIGSINLMEQFVFFLDQRTWTIFLILCEKPVFSFDFIDHKSCVDGGFKMDKQCWWEQCN